MKLPDLPLKGGCQCGAVRYSINSAPRTFYVCHCTDCQSQSGSAFGQSMQINLADFEHSGPTAEFLRHAASGRQMRCTFCPTCGTRLWHERAEGSDVAALKAGTLDDTSWLIPAAHIWIKSRQPWVKLPDEGLIYDGQPDMVELRQAWAALLSQP